MKAVPAGRELRLGVAEWEEVLAAIGGRTGIKEVTTAPPTASQFIPAPYTTTFVQAYRCFGPSSGCSHHSDITLLDSPWIHLYDRSEPAQMNMAGGSVPTRINKVVRS